MSYYQEAITQDQALDMLSSDAEDGNRPILAFIFWGRYM